MKANEIVETLSTRKGQHVGVTWQRNAKTRKGCAFVIEKRTFAYVRSGINYANLASVKDGIEAGERGEVQPLPAWQEWEQAPFILRHKTEGTQYVRLYPATFDNLKPKVEWLMDGVVSTFENVKPYLLASEYPKADDDKPACFAVKADSILDISE